LLSADGALDAEREPVVLLDGIEEGSFEVRTIDEQSRPGRWQERWDTSAQLPPQVRVRIRFREPQRRWPELVVATRLGAAFAATPPTPLAGGDGR
jgi:hypothetical protein